MICRALLNHVLEKLNSNGGLKRQHLEVSSSATKTLYLHYHSAYDHQTWQDGSSRDLEISRDKLKPLYLDCHSANGHETW